jgi:hypothetical protein
VPFADYTEVGCHPHPPSRLRPHRPLGRAPQDIPEDELGFTRDHATHTTALKRLADRSSVVERRVVLIAWLSVAPRDVEPAAADVGKISKQAIGEDGRPLHGVNVLAHRARVVMAGWPVGEDWPAR